VVTLLFLSFPTSFSAASAVAVLFSLGTAPQVFAQAYIGMWHCPTALFDRSKKIETEFPKQQFKLSSPFLRNLPQ
jgi:hypothetical protein